MRALGAPTPAESEQGLGALEDDGSGREGALSLFFPGSSYPPSCYCPCCRPGLGAGQGPCPPPFRGLWADLCGAVRSRRTKAAPGPRGYHCEAGAAEGAPPGRTTEPYRGERSPAPLSRYPCSLVPLLPRYPSSPGTPAFPVPLLPWYPCSPSTTTPGCEEQAI